MKESVLRPRKRSSAFLQEAKTERKAVGQDVRNKPNRSELEPQNQSTSPANSIQSPEVKILSEKSSPNKENECPVEKTPAKELRPSEEVKEPKDGEWEIGTVVWARMASFPFWPAIVWPREETGTHITIKRSLVEVNVLFLDDGRHSWVPARDLRLYAGLDAFLALREREKGSFAKLPASQRAKLIKAWFWNARNRSKVEGACKLADAAVAVENVQERIHRLRRCGNGMAVVASEEADRLAKLDQEIDSEDEDDDEELQEESESEEPQEKKRKSENKTKAESSKKAKSREPWSEDPVAGTAESNPVCHACRTTGSSLRRCKGACQRTFHTACLPDATSDGDMMCPSCSKGLDECLWCGKGGKGLLECSRSCCPTRVHNSCAQGRKIADRDEFLIKWVTPEKIKGSYVCPRHICHACHARCLDQSSRKEPLLRCIACPWTYHASQACLPAGTRVLNRRWLLCPRHFEPGLSSAKSGTHHVNTDTCAQCQMGGGTLVLCDTCTGSFHASCLRDMEDEVPPADRQGQPWECEYCRSGLSWPLYGDVVWAKLGAYRWWPALVLLPNQVPPGLATRPHSVGEFPVRFFGSNDTAWLTVGRAFLFDDSEGGSSLRSVRSQKGAMQASFLRALDEVAALFREREAAKAAREAEAASQLPNEGPPPVKLIARNETNRRVFPKAEKEAKVAISAQSADGNCFCADAKKERPCSDDTCTNRAMLFECHDGICTSGDKCGNRRFVDAEVVEPPLMVFLTEKCGWGVRSTASFSKGDFVCEYVGELIDENEFRRRWALKQKNRDKDFYFLTLEKDRTIDAEPKGNIARYINHSCEPNCASYTWSVLGTHRVGIFAERDIQPGEELTFHYNMDKMSADEALVCFCGAPSCQGSIGKRQTNAAASATTLTSSAKRKAKNPKRVEKERNCFHCGKGGDLVGCGRNGCPKVYHRRCVKVGEGRGRWECPWHYCNYCPTPRLATQLCAHCPNSFCDPHSKDEIHTVDFIYITSFRQ